MFDVPTFCHRSRSSHSKPSPGNSGIGYEITLQLALHGARVYIAGRSPERVKKAIEQMQESGARSLDLHMLRMDLQSLRSVKEGAESFMRQESRLDLLINNAGVRTLQLLSMPFSVHRKIEPANNKLLPNADHGGPLQAHSRRLRNALANQPSRPFPAHQDPPPHARKHRRIRQLQDTRPDCQRIKRCRVHVTHTQATRPSPSKP